ncbi:MAG TPA: alpha-amylase family glycosyl hydrolase, partial [Candidatus Limnocylindrales bacterium]
DLLGVYDPDVVAVQLNLISSHDAPRALTVLGGDTAGLRMATLLQCMLPGAPCIYYGDEIGMRGGNDPANRAGFPWDAGGWDDDLRSFVRSVLALRAAEPATRHGATTSIGADGPAMAIERRLNDARLILAMNAGDGEMELELVVEGIGEGRLQPVELAGVNPGSEVDVRDGRARIPVPPRTGRVLRVAMSDA